MIDQLPPTRIKPFVAQPLPTSITDAVESREPRRGPTGKRPPADTKPTARERSRKARDREQRRNKRRRDYEQWMNKAETAASRGESSEAIAVAMHAGLVPESNQFRYRSARTIRHELVRYAADTRSKAEKREGEMRRVLKRISAVTGWLMNAEEAGIPDVDDYVAMAKVFVPLEKLYADLGGLQGAKDAEYMAADAKQAEIESQQVQQFMLGPAQPQSIQRVTLFLAAKAELGQRTIDPAVVQRVMERQFGTSDMVEVEPGLYVPGEDGVDLTPGIDIRPAAEVLADEAADASTAEQALRIMGDPRNDDWDDQ